MNPFLSGLFSFLSLESALARKVLLTLLVVVLAVVARLLIYRYFDRRFDEESSAALRYRWHKISSYALTALAVFFVGSIWLQEVTGNLTTYLGLLSAGVAIALRDPLVNVAGWGYILWRRPFDLGDRIEIAGIKGDVIDKRIFAFTLMEVGNWVDAEQSTGRVMHVPNAYVFTNDIANYTQGFAFIWHEIPVVVTFESDWRKAKRLLEEIVARHAGPLVPEAGRQMRRATSRFMITAGALTPKVYTRVVDFGVQLTLRYLTGVRQRRGLEEAIWEEILDVFAEHPDIDLAYPTYRIYRPEGDREEA
ncbi:MAG: mechanosensitive ion channel family protein [Caldilineae bacterium]|nr:MAG: mechanosensitive ion channel family protein [Caldilineae bacterium]